MLHTSYNKINQKTIKKGHKKMVEVIKNITRFTVYSIYLSQ